jgi:PQQ-dependent catabolism-associated beta-propeller protein
VNTSETSNMAHFINLETRKVDANVLVDARPRVAMFTPNGREVWVSAEIGGTVSVIASGTRQITHKIPFAVTGLRREAIQPVGIQFTRDGKRAFVALGPAARIAVIDTGAYRVDKYLLVGQRAWNLALTADDKRLFTTNGVSNDISVIDVETLKVIKSVRVGRLPWGIVITP